MCNVECRVFANAQRKWWRAGPCVHTSLTHDAVSIYRRCGGYRALHVFSMLDRGGHRAWMPSSSSHAAVATACDGLDGFFCVWLAMNQPFQSSSSS